MIDKETLIKIRKKMEEYNHIDFNDYLYDYGKNLNYFQRKLVYSFIKCGFCRWDKLAKVFDTTQATIADKLPKSLCELDSILEIKILKNE